MVPATTGSSVTPHTNPVSAKKIVRVWRLSGILAELGARPSQVPPNLTNDGLVDSEGTTPRNVSHEAGGADSRHVKRRARKSRPRSDITIGEIVDRTSHAGFGILIALLAFISIPFFGLSLLFGATIGFLGVQMIVGRSRPWLPQKIRRHPVTMMTLDWLSRRLAVWTSKLERWVRPRWSVLTRPPFFAAVGVGVVVQSVGLAIPIPIPGSNWLFAVPILIYAIGLLEDDGLLVLLGHICTTAQIGFGFVFWQVIGDAFGRLGQSF